MTMFRGARYGLVGACLALALGGCGSGDGAPGGGGGSPGLAGIYKVQSDVLKLPCDGAEDPVTPPEPPYFLVVEEALLNGLFIDAYPCTGPERSTCDENGFPLLFLGKQVAAGEYAAGTYSKLEGSDTCQHNWLGARIKKTATGATLQKESRSEDQPKATCPGDVTDAEADRGPKLMSCKSMEVWVGVKP